MSEITIEYIGTQERWPELALTGKQSVWSPGQIESRPAAEAGALLATGLFSSPPVPVVAVRNPDGGNRFSGFAPGGVASVVLWGDSMERQLFSQQTYTAMTYDNATGVVTVTASNTLWVGYEIDFTVKGMPTWNHYKCPLIAQDSSSFQFQITPGLGDLPSVEKIVGRRHFWSASHPFTWLRSARPELLANLGMNGETTAEILARRDYVTAAIGNRGGVVVFVSGGANDIGTAAETVANLRLMARHVIGLGGIPVVRTIPPRDSMTAAQMTLMSEANREIRKFAQQIMGCYVSDRYAAIVNPVTGLARAGYLADGIHPAALGARMIAVRDQEQLDNIFGVLPSSLPQGQSDGYHADNNPGAKNVFDNPCLGVATGGTATSPASGTVAAGLTVSRIGSATTVVCSVVAGSVGNAQRVVFTPAAAGDSANITMSNQIARAPAGSRVRFLGRLKISDAANVRSASLLGYVVDGSTKISIYDKQAATTASANWPNENGEFDFETDWVTIPAAATQVYSRFQITFAAAGAAVTIEASQLALEIQ